MMGGMLFGSVNPVVKSNKTAFELLRMDATYSARLGTSLVIKWKLFVHSLRWLATTTIEGDSMMGTTRTKNIWKD